MHIHIHIHDQRNDHFEQRIFSLLNKIQMSEQEALDKINAYGAQLTKIGAEVTTVKDELAAAIAAGQTVPASLEAAINGLGSSIQAVDDLNPDAPTADPGVGPGPAVDPVV